MSSDIRVSSYNSFDPGDFEDDDSARVERVRPLEVRGSMPVGREQDSKAASKKTWNGNQTGRRISRNKPGFRNRRNKRIT